jgi:metal-responsive CopG/Arc/MetJ family transcriptional regulator
MKVKTSITLSDKLLEAVDKRARKHRKTRSDFIEVAVWAFIGQLIPNEQNAPDLEIINRRADFLNQEANDVLEYQAPSRQRPPTRG